MRRPAEAVHEVVSPTAPGHRDDEVAPVDLDQVAPEAVRSWRTPAAICAAATVVLVGATAAVLGGGSWALPLDERLHAFALAHRGALDIAVAGAVTWAGATTVALPVVAVVGALAPAGRRSWRDRVGSGALLVGIAATGVYAGLLLNGAVGRVRPAEADWAGAAGGPAFPSGHTTMGTLLAATCAWALCDRVTSTRGRVLLWSAAVVLAAAVGWSRWWLGVHWMTDVLGGWAVGAAWCAAAAALTIRLRR
ncbi:MAG: phosphatase PAP2 family protein [Candidatus Nanopelagicales bacterium]